MKWVKRKNMIWTKICAVLNKKSAAVTPEIDAKSQRFTLWDENRASQKPAVFNKDQKEFKSKKICLYIVGKIHLYIYFLLLLMGKRECINKFGRTGSVRLINMASLHFQSEDFCIAVRDRCWWKCCCWDNILTLPLHHQPFFLAVFLLL